MASERYGVYRCIVSQTATTGEPTWPITHGAPWRASEAICEWQSLPWHKRLWYWVVSAW